MKLLILILSIITISCGDSNKKAPKKITQKNTTIIQQNDSVIDWKEIKTKLHIKTPNYLIQIDNKKIQLPFNVSLKYSKKTYQGNYTFNWKLCDLIIDSYLSNYNVYGFEDNIPYKGFFGDEGKLHIVKTNDSTAVSIEKFEKLHSENYTKIYYKDNESIIYRTNTNQIAVLYFKYNKKEKAYFIYYKENNSHGYKYNPSKEELIDIAIVQLRMAKNFNKKKTETDLLNWEKYKNSLHSIDRKVFINIFKSILSSTDTIHKDTAFTPYIEGNYSLISLFNIGEEGKAIWTAINDTPKNTKINSKEPFNSSLLRQMSSVITLSNENLFEVELEDFKIEFKDESTIILKRDYETESIYKVFKKIVINKKEFLIFSPGIVTNITNSREMAYFYMSLFKNYDDL
ncbi:MAG: hypothetical protein ABJD66_03315 [Cellulophaga sp.]|uniref:hypothetical protein n=1 Tax=Cellulophaga sp. TaxID=1972202 RepID=UPI0032668485